MADLNAGIRALGQCGTRMYVYAVCAYTCACVHSRCGQAGDLISNFVCLNKICRGRILLEVF